MLSLNFVSSLKKALKDLLAGLNFSAFSAEPKITSPHSSTSPNTKSQRKSLPSRGIKVSRTWEDLKHYKKEDFADKKHKGSWSLMDIEVAFLCDVIADRLGWTPPVTSAVRGFASNAKVKGVSKSSHLPKPENMGKAKGVDLGVKGGAQRMQLVRVLLSLGIKRIGVYNKHIHFDTDGNLPQDVMWAGVSK